MIESSRAEDALLSKEALSFYDNECIDLYPLTARQVTYIFSLLRYGDWEARWVDRDKDFQLVEDVKAVLMGRCLEDLIKANLLFMGAITGRPVDLSSQEAVDALLTASYDFSEDGLVPTIRALSGATEDYSDEIEDVASKAATIATVLGYLA